MKTETIDEESETSQMSSPQMINSHNKNKLGSFKITPKKIVNVEQVAPIKPSG